MSATRSTETTQTSLARDLLYAARYYFGGRRGLMILAGATLIAGLVMNWSWLVASGIAPILISALPCAAMCALGLCMNKAGGKSCSKAGTEHHPTATRSADVMSRTQAGGFDVPLAHSRGKPLSGEGRAPSTPSESRLSKKMNTTDE